MRTSAFIWIHSSSIPSIISAAI